MMFMTYTCNMRAQSQRGGKMNLGNKIANKNYIQSQKSCATFLFLKNVGTASNLQGKKMSQQGKCV